MGLNIREKLSLVNMPALGGFSVSEDISNGIPREWKVEKYIVHYARGTPVAILKHALYQVLITAMF
jgi:hypothetical protein